MGVEISYNIIFETVDRINKYPRQVDFKEEITERFIAQEINEKQMFFLLGYFAGKTERRDIVEIARYI